MFQFTRPDIADGFESAVKPHRQAVQAAINNGDAPTFVEAWKNYKDVF